MIGISNVLRFWMMMWRQYHLWGFSSQM